MKPKEFKGVNVYIGKNQPEYETIPAHIDKDGVVTICWKLSPEELKKIKETGEIWHQVLTFGMKFLPVRLSAEPLIDVESGQEPEEKVPEAYKHFQDRFNEVK